MQAQVQHFYHEPTGTYSYVVWDPQTRHAAVIDPVLDYDAASGRTMTGSVEHIIAFIRAQDLVLGWILETHAHADHLTAAPYIKATLGGRIAIGAGILQVQGRFKPIFNLGEQFAVDGSQFDHLFADDERFQIGALEAMAIPTPGHTSDSLSYQIGDAVFVGDSLFMPDSGTARCDFPGGDAHVLYQSSRRLFQLPDDTRVFICHDYNPQGPRPRHVSTIRAQKHYNIHVREAVREDEFVRMRKARDATLGMPNLIIPSIQVNIQAGEFPAPEQNGVVYLKVPINLL
jgi:glyoxylase-like metal-dependent hydrolase (beta-lactamase superfamily II)